MRESFQSAHPTDSAEEVAQTIAEYNLLALPVIDDEGDIAGIVTVDDAMEILLPKIFKDAFRVFSDNITNNYQFAARKQTPF
jgi:Mg/Co/Ni transporter MgtE